MTATQVKVTRADIERDAREYLDRARALGQGNGHDLKDRIGDADFEILVKREIELTLRQLRKLGRLIED